MIVYTYKFFNAAERKRHDIEEHRGIGLKTVYASFFMTNIDKNPQALLQKRLGALDLEKETKM